MKLDNIPPELIQNGGKKLIKAAKDLDIMVHRVTPIYNSASGSSVKSVMIEVDNSNSDLNLTIITLNTSLLKDSKRQVNAVEYDPDL